MKKMIIFTLLVLCICLPLSGCSKGKSKKQIAFDAGQEQAQNSINREEVEQLVDSNKQAGIGSKVGEDVAKAKDRERVAISSSTDTTGTITGDISYIIDTNNYKVHKNIDTCELLGPRSGRVTLEPWSGTLESAVSAGYSKCAECILGL